MALCDAVTVMRAGAVVLDTAIAAPASTAWPRPWSAAVNLGRQGDAGAPPGAVLMQASGPGLARRAGRAAAGRRVDCAARRRDRRHRRRLGQRPERAAGRAVGPARAQSGTLRGGRRPLRRRALDRPRQARSCAWPTCPKTATSAGWCCPSRPGSRPCWATSSGRATASAAGCASARCAATAPSMMERYDVRPRNPQLLSASSAAATSRSWCWRARPARPQVLLVGQPTRGVDIGAIEFIHGRCAPCATPAARCWWCPASSTRSWRWPTA
jgi:hypothetical protein